MRRLAVLEIILELARTAGVTQLGQRLGLDLADALARHAKLASNLLERTGMTVLKAKTQLDNLALALRKSIENLRELLLQHREPKPVIAAVNGFAIGGGHVLHVVCDLTIASDNAVFGQTGPRVGSFDAGFGSSYLARVVGQKKAREIWFLCRKYNAQEALDMGLVNKVVPLAELEDEYVAWAEEMMQLSPLALRMIKVGLNAELDGQAGIQELAGDATMLYYMTDEAQEGGRAFLEKRKPKWNF